MKAPMYKDVIMSFSDILKSVIVGSYRAALIIFSASVVFFLGTCADTLAAASPTSASPPTNICGTLSGQHSMKE